MKIRQRTTVLETVNYVLTSYENIYNLAEKCFGEDSIDKWVIIADLNKPLYLWKVGDTIKLPKKVVLP